MYIHVKRTKLHAVRPIQKSGSCLSIPRLKPRSAEPGTGCPVPAERLPEPRKVHVTYRARKVYLQYKPYLHSVTCVFDDKKRKSYWACAQFGRICMDGVFMQLSVTCNYTEYLNFCTPFCTNVIGLLLTIVQGKRATEAQENI